MSLAASFNAARRFQLGTFEVDGFRFRITEGKKLRQGSNEPGYDYVLEMWTDGRYRKVPFSVVTMMVDFLYENEDLIYPRIHGYLGGKMFTNLLNAALRLGHARAMEEEKRVR